jgi:hypothetical protein
MVGVINPTSNINVTAYKAGSTQATSSTSPQTVQGGDIVPNTSSNTGSDCSSTGGSYGYGGGGNNCNSNTGGTSAGGKTILNSQLSLLAATSVVVATFLLI